MSYKIQYNEDDETVELIFEKTTSLKEINDARKDADKICHCKMCKRIFMDMANINTMNGLKFLDFYEFGVTWKMDTGSKSLRYAVILPKDPQLRKNMSFSITVGLNRGLSVKEFQQRKAAVQWLASYGS